MYSVLNTLSEYTYFYISKNNTSYTFLLVSKIVESFQCILKYLNYHQLFVLTFGNDFKKNCINIDGFLEYSNSYPSWVPELLPSVFS